MQFNKPSQTDRQLGNSRPQTVSTAKRESQSHKRNNENQKTEIRKKSTQKKR